jgi:hypothetical protein
MPIAYDPEDEWHATVDVTLLVACGTCKAVFKSPSLGLIPASGEHAAVVAAEAQSLGWQLVPIGVYRCPACAAKAP